MSAFAYDFTMLTRAILALALRAAFSRPNGFPAFLSVATHPWVERFLPRSSGCQGKPENEMKQQRVLIFRRRRGNPLGQPDAGCPFFGSFLSGKQRNEQRFWTHPFSTAIIAFHEQS
jgi:hypothetical protein